MPIKERVNGILSKIPNDPQRWLASERWFAESMRRRAAAERLGADQEPDFSIVKFSNRLRENEELYILINKDISLRPITWDFTRVVEDMTAGQILFWDEKEMLEELKSYEETITQSDPSEESQESADGIPSGKIREL